MALCLGDCSGKGGRESKVWMEWERIKKGGKYSSEH